MSSLLESVAEALKTREFTLREALLELAGMRALLRTFACDCAERVVWQLSYEGLSYTSRELEAIEVARFFIEGEASSRALREATRQAAGPWRHRYESSPQLGEQVRLLERSNISWVALRDPVGAAWGAILHSTEPEWQRRRLAWLCETWAICGERTPFLLRERQMPLDEPEDLRIQSRRSAA